MKLSRLQIFWLIFTFESGNMVLLTLSPTIQVAKQDAWISYLLATLLSILIVYIATKTALLYPQHTLVQFSKHILGKWLGTVVVISYLIQWYSINPILLMNLTDFLNTSLLPETPSWLIALSTLLLVIYVTNIGGIEGIGRCSEVFGPIIKLSILFVIIFIMKDFDIQQLLPVLADTGVKPIWEGTITPLSYFAEAVMMLMLVSFTDKPEQALKGALWGIISVALLVGVVTLSVLFTFGPEISAKMLYPAFEMISYISIMDFIQNIEILAILVWNLSIFIKLSLYFYLACYGTAQLFHIKNWKRMIWILSPLFFISAMLIPNMTYVLRYADVYWGHIALPINMVGIPILLWIVGTVRKKLARQ